MAGAGAAPAGARYVCRRRRQDAGAGRRPCSNTGQIYAYDDDARRLRPIFERLKRAGVRNVQVLEAGDEAALAALGARFDLVLVDAPCTGTGTWRREPDAKWRLKPANLPAAPGGAARRCSARRAASGQARRPRSSTSPARCCRRKTAIRSRPSSRTTPTLRRCRGASRGARGVGSEPPRSADGSEDDAAPHAGSARHRRLLHRSCCGRSVIVWRIGRANATAEACMKSTSSTDKSLTGIRQTKDRGLLRPEGSRC